MPITNSIFGVAAAGDFATTPLNASLALPAATGSGAAFIYEVGSAVPINLTAPGGTVGGVATFVASNHGAGAKLLVSDSAANVWDVSEVGAPVSLPLAYGRINASVTLASTVFPNTGFGALIPFTLTVYSSGVTFSGTTGIIPAKAGRYRASWLMVNGSEEFLDNGYFHVVQNGVSLGQVFYNMMEAAGVNQCAGFIDVDVAAGQAVSLYYRTAHTTDDTLTWDAGSYFQLDQLPTTETITAGTVVPTPPSHLVETITQAAHGLSFMNAVHHNGTAWVKSQANAAATVAQAVVVAVINANSFIVAYAGAVPVTAHGLTVGEYYWLSQGTAGLLTLTQPTSGIVQPILHVRSSGTLLLNIGSGISI